jgi:hypothetical protein
MLVQRMSSGMALLILNLTPEIWGRGCSKPCPNLFEKHNEREIKIKVVAIVFPI